MKQVYTFLIALSSITLISASGYAQRYEVALNGGLNFNGNPTSNMLYKGDQLTANYSVNLQCVRNLEHNLQFGVDVNIFELSRIFNEAQGFKIKDNNSRLFVYSELTTAACFVLNKKMNTEHGYFYGGLAMGGVITANMHKNATDAKSNYIAPNGGLGSCFGGQVGYTYYYTPEWALDFEIGTRILDVDYGYNPPEYQPLSSMHYNIMSYSFTIGFKYALGLNTSVPRGYRADDYIE